MSRIHGLLMDCSIAVVAAMAAMCHLCRSNSTVISCVSNPRMTVRVVVERNGHGRSTKVIVVTKIQERKSSTYLIVGQITTDVHMNGLTRTLYDTPNHSSSEVFSNFVRILGHSWCLESSNEISLPFELFRDLSLFPEVLV